MSDGAPRDLPAELIEVADALERIGDPRSGCVRRAARALATGAVDDRRRCGHCRAELAEPAHARRVYCSPSCRSRAWRERKRDGLRL